MGWGFIGDIIDTVTKPVQNLLGGGGQTTVVEQTNQQAQGVTVNPTINNVIDTKPIGEAVSLALDSSNSTLKAFTAVLEKQGVESAKNAEAIKSIIGASVVQSALQSKQLEAQNKQSYESNQIQEKMLAISVITAIGYLVFRFSRGIKTWKI